MFEKLSVQELFPTPVWICDLAEDSFRPLNRQLLQAIRELIEPRPPIEIGSTWQTDPVLHRLEPFAPFTGIVTTAARAALEFLGLGAPRFEITGCWGNINPKGGMNSSHTHPNNFLSGVYYVALPEGTGQIVFTDPRPQAGVMIPPTARYNKFVGNKITLDAKEGRLLLFPGWLLHSVPVNRSETERVSISFNIMFSDYTEAMSRPLWAAGTAPIRGDRGA
jgi:uncharacterized protein (TIGR02466 family)